MKKLVLAAFAATAMTGIAVAREAPILYGDVSASTANTASNNEVFRGEATPPREVLGDLDMPDLDLDLMATGSVEMSESDGQVTLEDATNPTMNDNLRGR